MPTHAEISVVNVAGAVQGIVSSRFRQRARSSRTPDRYDLSSSQYGLLFVPQVVTAIAAAHLGPPLGPASSQRTSTSGGLLFGQRSMVLLLPSRSSSRRGRVSPPPRRNRLLGAGVAPHLSVARNPGCRTPSGGGRTIDPRARTRCSGSSRLSPRSSSPSTAGSVLLGPSGDSMILLGALVHASIGLPLRVEARAPAVARAGARYLAASACTPALRCSTGSARR